MSNGRGDMPQYDDEIEFSPFSEQGWDDFQKRVMEPLLPSEETMRKALGAANIRMSQLMRAKAGRELSAILKIPRKVISHRFRSFRTWGKIRGGKLWMGLDGIPFIKLDPYMPDGRKDGVRTRLGDYHDPHAFMVTVPKTGHMTVFRRVGKDRKPLTIPRVDIHDPCFLWLKKQVDSPWFSQKFFERLEREIRWRTTAT